MADITQCPSCKARYRTAGLAAGKRIRCRKCQTVIVVDEELLRADTVHGQAVKPGTDVESKPRYAGEFPDLIAGQVLGRCRILRELGHGAMGGVHLAQHTTLDIPVAIKVLPPRLASRDPQFVERFLREARLAAKIEHPNVIGVKDVDQDATTGFYYIVLEYVDGGSVRDRLRREGPLPVDQALRITADVTRALTAAAQHAVVHRDIKPDNIMLTRGGQVKLADMGIAKQQSDDTGVTMSQAMIGTPAYMSPEQATDAKNVDARADIYSLGATLYHMLVGVVPYDGDTVYTVLTKLATEPTPDPRAVRPEIPATTAQLCMKMMAKNPAERYQTPQELLAAIEGAIAALDSLVLMPDSPPAVSVQPSGSAVATGEERSASVRRRVRKTAKVPAVSEEPTSGVAHFARSLRVKGALVAAGLLLLCTLAVLLRSGPDSGADNVPAQEIPRPAAADHAGDVQADRARHRARLEADLRQAEQATRTAASARAREEATLQQARSARDLAATRHTAAVARRAAAQRALSEAKDTLNRILTGQTGSEKTQD